jgi:hypothetical protein
MKRHWLILFVTSSIWGQSLNFTNKDSTIIIKPSQLVNLNGARYVLIHTDYDKQQIVLETEIPDSAPFKYLREPIEGAFFYFGILKIPIYKYLKNTKYQMQDTLTFESIKSFKYYDKSKDSFLFNQKKAALIGAFSGFIVGFLSEPESIEWAILGSILWGGIGAINGSIYGLLIPRESEILILGDKEWKLTK